VEEELGTQEVNLVLSIDSVAFREGNKWRLSDGDTTFWADIDDEAWLARVKHGRVSFRSGDMLRCRVEITQSAATVGSTRTGVSLRFSSTSPPRSSWN
jgi:hypothetical protein